MHSFAVLADGYAKKIREAGYLDSIARTAGLMTKSAELATGSNLAKAIREIGTEVERLVYENNQNQGLTEADKQSLVEELARKLNFNDPKTLRRIIKGGSVDSLMNMSQEMENLFTVVKK